MDKRGFALVESETVEYILLVVLGITLLLMLSNIVNVERYNQIKADDIALTLNSVFISKGNVVLDYDVGGERNIIFSENAVRTYVDDPLRERNALVLIDRNYAFDDFELKTSFFEISKFDNGVLVG